MTIPAALISPEKAATVCTQAAEAYASAGATWPDAIHHTVRNLIDRLATNRGLTAPGLPRPANPAADLALDQLGPLTGWHILDLGEIHQLLLELTPHQTPDGVRATRTGQARRDIQGAWYTPPEIADAMCRLSLGPHLDRLTADPDPAAIFDLCVIDPSCGAGIFSVAAARLITDRLAARVSGQDPPPAVHVRAALPVVMRECIFAIDIDPVAVDLTKAALWLETRGREPFTFMDCNVIVGDPLEGDLPAAYRDRHGATRHQPVSLTAAA